MMKRIAAAIIGLFLIASPASAQFADQATYAGTGAGSANAQTILLPNATQYTDLTGVLIKYIPGVTNTAAATLAVSGNGGALTGGPIAFRKPSIGGLVALTGTELIVGQPVWIMYDGTFFDVLSVTSSTVTAANLANSALGFLPVNVQLNAAVSANALTISLCSTNSGNNTCINPSATSPVLIPFRDATIAFGDPTIVPVTGATSFTIASGQTMGCVNNQMCRLWVLAFNNAGTVQLCAFNALSGTSVAPINEGVLQTSQSGTSGGSSAQLYYCNASAVTNKASRILGYVEISESTAGTWATGPTYVQLFGPGIKKPGDVVQTINPAPITTLTNLLTAQTQTGVTASIIPTSAANIIRVRANVSLTVGSADQAAIRLSRGTGPTLFGTNTMLNSSGGNTATAVPVTGTDVPNTTSSTTYYIYGQATPSGGGVVNDNVATAYNPSSDIILEEIMSSLEPANDDQPLRMVG